MNSIEPIMPWALGANYPRWKEKLRDGTCVEIRPVHEDDLEREKRFITSLSPEARRYRFLGQIRQPSDQLLAQLTHVDYQHDVALAALVADQPGGDFIAVGRYNTGADGTSCECAVAVLDQWQHKGMGSLLMRHLVDIARARGINYIYSLDAAENSAMAELADYLGFDRRVDRDDPTLVVHSLWLEPPSK